jgi:hypothetical protein
METIWTENANILCALSSNPLRDVRPFVSPNIGASQITVKRWSDFAIDDHTDKGDIVAGKSICLQTNMSKVGCE